MKDMMFPDLTERVRLIRDDGVRRDLLITARLDPEDQIVWEGVLRPTLEDAGLERSAAARLTALLASVSRDAHALTSPPSFIEAWLLAAGWTSHRVDRCLRGSPVSGMFGLLSPALESVVTRCRSWLVGGWLDATMSRELKRQLDESTKALDDSRDAAAASIVTQTGLPVDDVTASLDNGIAELRAMLGQPDESNVLWIIQD